MTTKEFTDDHLNGNTFTIDGDRLQKTNVKLEIFDESVSNVKLEYDSNDSTKVGSMDVDEIFIKEEPLEITDCVKDEVKTHEIMLHKTVEQQVSCDYVDIKDKITIQELGNVSVKDEVYDTFNFVDTKQEHSIGNLRCEECGMEYEIFCCKCSMLLHILHTNVAYNIVDRAKRTIPKNVLKIKRSLDHVGVFALRPIPKHVLFGPFHGLTPLKTTAGSIWKLRNGKVYAENENKSNWMQYVNSIETSNSMNLVPLQYEGNLYYRSAREISEDEELLVYYSEELSDILNDGETYYHPDIESGVMKVYGCTFCCLGFSSRMYLEKHKTKCPHTRKADTVKEIIQCIFCRIYLDEKEYSEYHIHHCCEKYTRKWILPTHSDKNALPGMKITNFEDIYDMKKNARDDKDILPLHSAADAKKYSCSSCDYHTDVESDLNQHVATHRNGKPFLCRICNKGFKLKYQLKRHISTHTELKPYECQLCDYKYKQKKDLVFHVKRVHGTPADLKVHTCSICNYKANDKRYFKQHLNKHAGTFKCEVCDKCFATNAHLKMHSLTHTGEKLFSCDLCAYKCNRKNYLTLHMVNKHSGTDVEMYRCPKCSYQTRQKLNLAVHVLVHTSTDEKKRYKCDSCRYDTNHMNSLRQHVSNKHGKWSDKKYKCEHCEYATNHKNHFAAHLPAHDVVKAFECKICGKRFRRNSELNQHIHIHMEGKLFSCPHCEYGTNRRRDLHSHMVKRHIGDDDVILVVT